MSLTVSLNILARKKFNLAYAKQSKSKKRQLKVGWKLNLSNGFWGEKLKARQKRRNEAKRMWPQKCKSEQKRGLLKGGCWIWEKGHKSMWKETVCHQLMVLLMLPFWPRSEIILDQKLKERCFKSAARKTILCSVSSSKNIAAQGGQEFRKIFGKTVQGLLRKGMFAGSAVPKKSFIKSFPIESGQAIACILYEIVIEGFPYFKFAFQSQSEVLPP